MHPKAQSMPDVGMFVLLLRLYTIIKCDRSNAVVIVVDVQVVLEWHSEVPPLIVSSIAKCISSEEQACH